MSETLIQGGEYKVSDDQSVSKDIFKANSEGKKASSAPPPPPPPPLPLPRCWLQFFKELLALPTFRPFLSHLAAANDQAATAPRPETETETDTETSESPLKSADFYEKNEKNNKISEKPNRNRSFGCSLLDSEAM